jgi:CheY-like chemotaxis protein
MIAATAPELTAAQEAAKSIRLPEVVVIDDNPADIELVRLAFEEARIPVRLRIARDGTSALALLRDLPQPPAIVLLDLRLPGVPGSAVLTSIRHEARWNDVPVILLSSSLLESDIDTCVQLGAAAFKTKPNRFDGYVRFVQSLTRYF